MVYLYTGDIQTGKSTSLYQLIQTFPGIAGGFVTPTLHDGKKHIINTKTLEVLPFELDPESKEHGISVGRFLLSQEGFNSATAWTKYHFMSSEVVIIDELGKLEIEETGFHALFSTLLQEKKTNHIIIAVVRKSLLAEIMKKYTLENPFILEHPYDLSRILKS